MCGMEFMFCGNMVELCRNSHSHIGTLYAICMHMLMISVHCSLYCLVLATALQFKAVYASVWWKRLASTTLDCILIMHDTLRLYRYLYRGWIINPLGVKLLYFRVLRVIALWNGLIKIFREYSSVLKRIF